MQLKRNKTIEKALFILLTIETIKSLFTPCYFINNQWHSHYLIASYQAVENMWYEFNDAQASLVPSVNLQHITTTYMGKRISYQGNLYGQRLQYISEVKDYVDYLARYVYCQVFTLNNPIGEAYKLAHKIKSNLNKGIILEEAADVYSLPINKFKIFLDPSNDSWRHLLSNETTKENLFIHCIFLGSALLGNHDLPRVN